MMQRGSPVSGAAAAVALLVHHHSKNRSNMNPGTRSIRLTVGLSLAPIILVLGIIGIIATRAHAALPDCGGNATIVTAPYSCQQTRTIQGFNLTVTIVVSDVGHAVVTYTLDKPAPSAFPIKVRWHEGLSSTAPLTVETQGTFAKGATSAVLELTKCGGGQLGGQMDVKAVFIANGDERGRVVAPYIAVPATCGTVATTVATTAPTTAPVSSVASSVPGSSPSPTATTSAPLTTARVSGAQVLPVTGGASTMGLVLLGLSVLALASILVALGRKRAET